MELDDLSAAEISSDIKVEVIAADLVEKGVDIDDIVVTPMGLFERVFRRDILRIQQRHDKLGIKELVFIDVSREGIYNSLPEALFHYFELQKKNNSANFIEEYKRHKTEEENARQFFLASEKELYRLRVLSEMEERKSMLGFTDQYKSELFLNLWPELGEISDEYLPSMLLLLPISHKIVGNIELAQIMISYVIDQPVKIRYNDSTRPVNNDTGSNVLGERYLANDCIIGNEVPDYTPLISISVGPVKKGNLMKLMPGGEVRKVLDLACKYLFPVAMDINIFISLDIDDEKLILSDDISDGKLGLTSRL